MLVVTLLLKRTLLLPKINPSRSQWENHLPSFALIMLPQIWRLMAQVLGNICILNVDVCISLNYEIDSPYLLWLRFFVTLNFWIMVSSLAKCTFFDDKFQYIFVLRIFVVASFYYFRCSFVFFSRLYFLSSFDPWT